MIDQTSPIDHGSRANESDFGGLDELSSAAPWRTRESWRIPVLAGGVAAESLPFTVGIVSSESMLARVQELRQLAYGHHLPEHAFKFGRADSMDRLESMTLFYAEDKDTGRLLGSARLQSNLFGPLQIEASLGSMSFASQYQRFFLEVGSIHILQGAIINYLKWVMTA